MKHLDPDDLVVLALGNERDLDLLSPDSQTHLAACVTCARELHELRRTVDAGRPASPVELLTADPAVWARVHDALGLSAELAQLPLVTPQQPVPEVPAPKLTLVNPLSSPVPITAPRRRLWMPLAAAALIGIVAGVAGALAWPESSPSVMARAALSPLPGWDTSGEALLTADDQGRLSIVVTLDAQNGAQNGDDASRLQEVWLLAADATRLISLGHLDGQRGVFTVPAGLNLGEYPLVDVSAEPVDGDPSHSGDSIVRGELHTP